jgi:hypothetical protein
VTLKAILAALAILSAVTPVFAAETEQKYGNSPESFEIKFYMQPRFTYDFTEDASIDHSFAVRRGRVYLTSTVAPNVKGRIQMEVKPEKVEALDVYFDWGFMMDGKKPLILTVGQFKKPFSYQELVMSSSNLNLIDRTSANSFLEKSLFASARDQGAMLTADLWEYDRPVTLMAGFFNGNGLGQKADNNTGKQVVARADVTPTTGLSLGGNLAMNRMGIADSSESYLVYGGDVVYEKQGFQFVGEVFGGDNYAGVAADQAVPSEVPSFMAFYGEAIYRAPSGWEPGARVEIFDPDTDTDDDGKTILTGQIARTFSPNFRWQINVISTSFQADGLDPETMLISQWTVRL